MPLRLQVCGISHHETPLALRELLAFQGEDLTSFFQTLRSHADIHEAVWLSTCNRTELYAVSDASLKDFWLTELSRYTALPLEAHSYRYENREALKHLLRVATGLDAQQLGESHILGQVKKAFDVARGFDLVGQVFHRVFPFAFRESKKIRTHTELGVGQVSVPSAVRHLCAQFFSNLGDCRVLVLGSGEMASVAAHYFFSLGSAVHMLTDHPQGFPWPTASYASKETWLSGSDVVIAATHTQQPLLTQTMMQNVLKHRHRTKPMVLVDLGVPRNIEAQVSCVDDVYLFNLDDLARVTGQHQQARREAASMAAKNIEASVEAFWPSLRLRAHAKVLATWQEKQHALSTKTLCQAQALLRSGRDPEDVLLWFSDRLSKRLNHSGLQVLKRALEEDPQLLRLWSDDASKS